jgi:ABC-2 type transport system permease protein
MNLFKMELRQNLKTLVIWTAVSGALTLLLTLLYPAMLGSDMLALFNAKLASLPKELVAMFNLSGEDIR